MTRLAQRNRQKTVETIGQRLRQFRRERGITQVELAEMLGVAQPVVSDYERGEIHLSDEQIVKLARILRVSADQLLGLEPPTTREDTIGNRRLLRRLREIDRLPQRDQQALFRTINAFLERAS